MEVSEVAETSALEWFFDHFIENNSWKVEEEEEKEEEVKEKPELLVSSQPDESTQEDANTDGEQTDGCTALNYSSQNSTAAVELPGAASESFSVGPTVTPKPGVVPQIQNIMSTANLGCNLDLHFIANKAWNVEYRPKVYNSLIMRIREPRTTAMIYQSGNLVCTGAKSEEQSRLAARKYARIIQKLGFPVRFLNFRIHNLVASCKMFPLSLDRMALAERCSYEPELFPGLLYRVKPGVTATIFSSGKMSLSGAKKAAEMYEAFDTIYPILSRFRRQ